jgi:hypothetical protein
MFEHYFETSSGEVGFLAEVETSGSILILKDVAVSDWDFWFSECRHVASHAGVASA